GRREGGAEVADAVEQLDGLEITARAGRVHEAARLEPELLEEHEPDSPMVLVDGLPTVSAARAAGGGALGPVDPRHPTMLDAESGGRGQVAEVMSRRQRRHRLEERLGPLVRGAARMEPERHLALAECVWLTLAETPLV